MLTLILILAAGGDGFFAGRAVDFWEDRRDTAVATVEVWTDSEAPPPVRRLLETPTREHAEAYLAWQHERMRRLQVAFEVVEEVQAESRPKGEAPCFTFPDPAANGARSRNASSRGFPSCVFRRTRRCGKSTGCG